MPDDCASKHCSLVEEKPENEMQQPSQQPALQQNEPNATPTILVHKWGKETTKLIKLSPIKVHLLVFTHKADRRALLGILHDVAQQYHDRMLTIVMDSKKQGKVMDAFKISIDSLPEPMISRVGQKQTHRWTGGPISLQSLSAFVQDYFKSPSAPIAADPPGPVKPLPGLPPESDQLRRKTLLRNIRMQSSEELEKRGEEEKARKKAVEKIKNEAAQKAKKEAEEKARSAGYELGKNEAELGAQDSDAATESAMQAKEQQHKVALAVKEEQHTAAVNAAVESAVKAKEIQYQAAIKAHAAAHAAELTAATKARTESEATVTATKAHSEVVVAKLIGIQDLHNTIANEFIAMRQKLGAKHEECAELSAKLAALSTSHSKQLEAAQAVLTAAAQQHESALATKEAEHQAAISTKIDELATRDAAHSKAIAVLEADASAALESAVRAREGELAAELRAAVEAHGSDASAALESAVQAKQAEHAIVLKAREAEHEAALREKVENNKAKVKAKAEEHEAALIALHQSHADAISAAVAIEVEAKEEEFAAACEGAVQDTEEQYAAALFAKSEAHAAATKAMMAAMDTRDEAMAATKVVEEAHEKTKKERELAKKAAHKAVKAQRKAEKAMQQMQAEKAMQQMQAERDEAKTVAQQAAQVAGEKQMSAFEVALAKQAEQHNLALQAALQKQEKEHAKKALIQAAQLESKLQSMEQELGLAQQALSNMPAHGSRNERVNLALSHSGPTGTHERREESEAHHRAVLIDLYSACNPSKLPMVEEILAEWHGRENDLMDTLREMYPHFFGDRSASSSDPEKTAKYRAMLKNVYALYNPSKLSEVDAILHTWEGNEQELEQLLREKYPQYCWANMLVCS
jgi:hypothetical protein